MPVAMKKDERYNERIQAADSEIQELEDTLETLLKKFENEQEHSAQLETEVQELSDKHQREMADIQTELDGEKKKVSELEETIETKIAQVRGLTWVICTYKTQLNIEAQALAYEEN